MPASISARIHPKINLTYLLIDITITWSPPVHLIVTASTIHGWLRINTKESELVQLRELLADDVHLRGRASRRSMARQVDRISRTSRTTSRYPQRMWAGPRVLTPLLAIGNAGSFRSIADE